MLLFDIFSKTIFFPLSLINQCNVDVAFCIYLLVVLCFLEADALGSKVFTVNREAIKVLKQ